MDLFSGGGHGRIIDGAGAVPPGNPSARRGRSSGIPSGLRALLQEAPHRVIEMSLIVEPSFMGDPGERLGVIGME
jgi:hypothetical protein